MVFPPSVLVFWQDVGRNQSEETHIQFGGTVIQPSATVMILSVIANAGLTFEFHVSTVIHSAIYTMLGDLSKTARGLPRDAKMIAEMLIPGKSLVS